MLEKVLSLTRMNCYRVFLLLALIWLAAFQKAVAQSAVKLNNQPGRIYNVGNGVAFFEDKSGALKLENLSDDFFDFKNFALFNHRNRNAAYWLRFDIEVEEPLRTFRLFEIQDFKIDSFELYMPDPARPAEYLVRKGGDAYPFDARAYYNKNFAIELPLYDTGIYTFYLRIKAKDMVGFSFVVTDYKHFLEYASSEYLLLSLFYGVIISMALSSLFLYFYLHEKAYLFFALYTLSVGLYFLTRDGLGFQFLWPNFPVINNYVQPVSVCLTVFFNLYFVKYYFNIPRLSPSFNRVLTGLLIGFPIVVYIIEYVFGLLPEPLMAVAIPFAFVFVFLLLLMRRRYLQASFFVMAYGVFFVGMLVYLLVFLRVIPVTILTFYSINLVTASKIIILSLALAGKVKQLMREKEELKDSANRMLEKKVQQRTKELEERNSQLDVFVYKASHDIRGPLKSMVGLTTLALKDVQEPKALEYFEYLLRSSNKLNDMVGELLRMGKVKDLEVKNTEVNIYEVVQDVIRTLYHLEGIERMNIEVRCSRDYKMYTDALLLYSVCQNIVENAIKYQDRRKTDSYLFIDLKENGKEVIMTFEDNGLGIPDTLQKRVFDMFYKIHANASGTGLGLYLTRLTVEKMGGTIIFHSQEGKGTTFTISLPKIAEAKS
jgi:signal transduction histidine kinase